MSFFSGFFRSVFGAEASASEVHAMAEESPVEILAIAAEEGVVNEATLAEISAIAAEVGVINAAAQEVEAALEPRQSQSPANQSSEAAIAQQPRLVFSRSSIVEDPQSSSSSSDGDGAVSHTNPKSQYIQAMESWGNVALPFYDAREAIQVSLWALMDSRNCDKKELLASGATAFMRGYIFNKKSVYYCDAAEWLSVLDVDACTRVDYLKKLPQSVKLLLPECNGDIEFVLSKLRNRRAQLMKKRYAVLADLGVIICIYY